MATRASNSARRNVGLRLRPISAGIAVPIFDLLSAGVTIGGVAGLADALIASVAVGIIAGLVIGKTIGVAVAAVLVARFTAAKSRVPDSSSRVRLRSNLRFDDVRKPGSAQILVDRRLAGARGRRPQDQREHHLGGEVRERTPVDATEPERRPPPPTRRRRARVAHPGFERIGWSRDRYTDLVEEMMAAVEDAKTLDPCMAGRKFVVARGEPEEGGCLTLRAHPPRGIEFADDGFSGSGTTGAMKLPRAL
ncbi:Na+/H+ antiporter NhaA [Catellatospora citrea]|uniref:Na+/H+ antiporter NhaA n=1 Tax=Catellatospora citrea TaxID=53366 RepID=UPI003F4CE2CC